MNRIPQLRRRVAARIACATAVAVGAALLVAPGTANAAIEDVDCTAIGDSPSATGFESALETAVACGVEVRIEDHSDPYETYFATPDRLLHRVQTVDPVNDNRDLGPVDASLTESDGALVQANSPISFTLSGTDTELPLIRGMGAALDWTGTVPAPAVSENTAVYDGLAEGLDLTVRTEIAGADLQFTIADPAAWQELSTKLTFTGVRALSTLYAPHPNNTGWDHWTPMTVRDANGAVHTAATSLSSGALTLTVDQAVLDSAAYPLTLTTQATTHRTDVNEWGVLTSAFPAINAFRGDAGLDQPYLEAAGQGADAVVGTYCDAVADSACDTEFEAVVYWNFWGSSINALRPASGVSFTQSQRVFSVHAADPTACVAPSLHSSSDVYRPSSNWTTRPAASPTKPPVAGECQDGTAVYDLTGSSTSASLGMHSSEEIARFDGGSARMDTYYTISSSFTLTKPSCGTETRLQATAAVTYGNFSADIWREDLMDPGLVWSAAISDSETGETVFSTEPAAVTGGKHPSSTISLPDGTYQVKHRFTAALTGYDSTVTCHIRIDTAAPDLISIDVEDGPYYLWDTVTVEVEVSDEGFPDGVNSLNLWCGGGWSCSPRTVTLTSETTASFEVRIEKRSTTISISATDKAGNSTTESVQIIATEPSNDYDLDGYQDLVTVRNSDGALLLHPGKGDGTFGAARTMGTGWNGLDVVMAGDLTGDRLPDLLARDNKTGYLYTYPGDGEGKYQSRIQVGPGWGAISDFTSALDFDGNGTIDLIALSERASTLYFYPGDGKGAFGARSKISSNWVDEWTTLDNLTTIGDIGYGVGTPDLLAWYGPTGGYLVFQTDGDGGMEYNREIEPDLIVDYADNGSRYSQVVGGGEYTGDDWSDIYAVDARTGSLVRRSYDQNLQEMTGSATVATGWGAYRLAVADSERAYDYYSDGANEILARKASTGELFSYTGDASGGIGRKGWFSDDFKNANLIETAGDINGDGHNDVITRVASTGSLYVLPGNGQHLDNSARIHIGPGWNAMSAIVSGHDFNGDGKVDVIAREQSTGSLWFYPGKGNGTLASRVKVGSGWNAMRDIIAPGDLDHDGKADLLAIRSSDNCVYFYGGRGDGTLKPAVKMSCGWAPYNGLAAAGDFDNDGHADWIARRTTDGALFLYRGNGAGGYTTRPQLGTSGWNAMNIIA